MNASDFLLTTHVCPPNQPERWGTLLSSPYEQNGVLWVPFFQGFGMQRMPLADFARQGWWRSNNCRLSWMNPRGEIIA